MWLSFPCLYRLFFLQPFHPAVDCMVSEWSEWSECNKSCGKGHTIRTRMVKLEPQFGGSACPETIQRKKCKIRKCRTKPKDVRGGGGGGGGRGGGGRRRRRGKQGEDAAAVEEQPGWSWELLTWYMQYLYRLSTRKLKEDIFINLTTHQDEQQLVKMFEPFKVYI